MVEPVKTRRRYDNSRRQAQARATRAEVVAAARLLFLARGYPATSIEAIGEAADVPLATIYRLFGSKRGILSAVLDVTFVGDDELLALHDRPDARAAATETDPQRLLAGYAHLARGVLERSGPLQQVLRTAAAVDRECADLLETTRQQRIDGQSRIARALAAQNALADGLTEPDALDIIYTLMSPEAHHILTVERHWSADHYEQWLARTLAAALLPPHARRSVLPSKRATSTSPSPP
jgi:AcrR family transcriptional regulator